MVAGRAEDAKTIDESRVSGLGMNVLEGQVRLDDRWSGRLQNRAVGYEGRRV